MPEFDDKRLTVPDSSPGRAMQVITGAAPLRAAPDARAEMVSQALYGEVLSVHGEAGGYVQVQLARDRYVGWMPAEALSSDIFEPTHRLSAVRSFIHSEPTLKCATLFPVSMGARLRVTGQEGRYLKLAGAGWVPEQHVAPRDRLENDPADVAERFLHTPYLWGGCDSVGLDCTGLTRAAFEACGVTLPRDSDMQFSWCGQAIDGWKQPGALSRGDLVFWKGHVGIMLDADTLLHANAHHMATAKESFTGAVERIAKIYGEPIGARRIDVAAERAREPDWLKAG